MKKLYYKEYKGLQVFCQKCRSIITANTKATKKCNHPIERQIYKANIIVPDSGGKRRTKNLVAREFDQAVIELINFKKEVEKPELFLVKADEKPDSLIACIAMYIDYVQDVDVPHHQKKHLSKMYIKGIQTEIQSFLLFIKKNIEPNIAALKIKDINDNMVGAYCKYIEDKGYSTYTYRSKIKALRTLYNYLITKKNYTDLTNIWQNVKLKTPKPTNISINSKDFFAVLNIISPIDSIQKVGKSNKNRYKTWLKDFIKLKAFTGLRNEEVASLTWNMVKFEDNKPLYVESPNLKVNRQKNNFNIKDLEYVYIPVAKELLEVLNSLGLSKNKQSNKYIIAPDFKNRYTISKQVSKSFSFYWSKLDRNYKRSLKDLRKSYATSERIFNNSNLTTLHANVEVTEKHYINQIEIVKQMVYNNFMVFPEAN